MADTPEPELPPSERSHIRHRDRKRETRMVVDNAGVKRLLPALEKKRRQRRPPSPGEPDQQRSG